jgi:murein DD-endopeptidase / murein LD-carboxypeptidase
MRARFADRARALVGTRFRPQGRAAETGLDCLGLIMVVFGLDHVRVRRTYRLRGDHKSELEAGLRPYFRRIWRPQAREGDVVMAQVAADQIHLAVLTRKGFVHADARLGKVVETPGAPPWPVLRAIRRRQRKMRVR